MKATLLTLATLTALATATPDKNILKRAAKCDTADAEPAPADNDCLDLITELVRDYDKEVDAPAGSWTTLKCSHSCAIAVRPDEGSSFTNEDVFNDAQSVISECGLDDSNDPIDFKGEVSGDGRTVSVYKGGSC